MNTTISSAATTLAIAIGLGALAAPAADAHDGHHEKKPAKQVAKTQQVAIEFAAVAGTTPVACGREIAGLGTTSRTATLTDLRFFVSDVKLLRKDGKAVTVRLARDSPFRVTRGKAAVTLIDLENGRGGCAEGGTKAINAFVRGTVPTGDYVGARWSVGVPFALNHTDATTAPAPLNSTAMAWSWQVGRKFTKIEVSDPGASAGAAWTERTFYVHLGSTGCSGNPATGETARCSSSNRPDVTLRRFDTSRQRVAVDLKAMLSGVDVTVNGGGAGGCMAGMTDPECGPIFRAFGLRQVDTGGGMDMGGGMEMGSGGMDMGGMSASASAALKQSVFRAIGR